MARKSRKSGTEQAAPEVGAVIYNTALYVRLSVLDSGKKDTNNTFVSKNVAIAYNLF